MFEGRSEGMPAWQGASSPTVTPALPPETSPHKRPGNWWSEEQELPRLISECHISPTKRQRVVHPGLQIHPPGFAVDLQANVVQSESPGFSELTAAGDASFHGPPLAGTAHGAMDMYTQATSPPPIAPALSSQLAIVPYSASSGPDLPGLQSPMAVPRGMGQGGMQLCPPISVQGSLTEWGKRLIKGGHAAGEMMGIHQSALLNLAHGKPIEIKGGKSLTQALDLMGTNEAMHSQGHGRMPALTRGSGADMAVSLDVPDDDQKDDMES